MAQNAPHASFGANLDAFLGPAQFKFRTPEASLRFPKGGLRIEADCTIWGPCADYGLHVGCLAL
eukprot:15472376-Alexandrium_andersonii.AAC.1